MAKSPDAFRTISEVAAQLDTPAHVLRFWESKFPQVRPVKRAGGRRYYRPDDIALLAGIKVLLHEQCMTIRGVQKLLRERGPRHVATLSALPWEGEEAVDVPPAGQEEPEAVVVGPWPGADEAAAAGTDAAGTAARGPAPPAPRATIADGLLAAMAGGPAARTEAGGAAGPLSLARLREALARADRDRLRADATRLRPLVERLRDLRGGGPGQAA